MHEKLAITSSCAKHRSVMVLPSLIKPARRSTVVTFKKDAIRTANVAPACDIVLKRSDNQNIGVMS
jgi:hypothetical protein